MEAESNILQRLSISMSLHVENVEERCFRGESSLKGWHQRKGKAVRHSQGCDGGTSKGNNVCRSIDVLSRTIAKTKMAETP